MSIPAVIATPPAQVTIYQKKVLIVCPWYKTASPITAFAVAQLHDKRRTSMMMNWGDAFVAHTRNHCADYFLKSELEWMLTIDDDTVPPFGNAQWFRTYTGWPDYPEPFASFNALDRLMSHQKTLVGGLYFGKHSTGRPVIAEGGNPTYAEWVRKGPHDEIRPTKWLGTGCMLIHRSVYEDIEKKFPYLARGADGTKGQWFSSSETHALDCLYRTREMLSQGPMTADKAFKAYELVEAGLAEARDKSPLGQGEDVFFCKRAAEAGHQPYIDLGLVCGHAGNCIYGAGNTGLKK